MKRKDTPNTCIALLSSGYGLTNINYKNISRFVFTLRGLINFHLSSVQKIFFSQRNAELGQSLQTLQYGFVRIFLILFFGENKN